MAHELEHEQTKQCVQESLELELADTKTHAKGSEAGEGLPNSKRPVKDKDDTEDGVTGRWTREEHARFVEALQIYGKNWKKVQMYVGTRSTTQARSHAQKYFAKLLKSDNPPPVLETPPSPETTMSLTQSPVRSPQSVHSFSTSPKAPAKCGKRRRASAAPSPLEPALKEKRDSPLLETDGKPHEEAVEQHFGQSFTSPVLGGVEGGWMANEPSATYPRSALLAHPWYAQGEVLSEAEESIFEHPRPTPPPEEEPFCGDFNLDDAVKPIDLLSFEKCLTSDGIPLTKDVEAPLLLDLSGIQFTSSEIGQS